MIDLIGSIFTKKMFSDTIGSAIGKAFMGGGDSGGSRTPPPNLVVKLTPLVIINLTQEKRKL